MKLLIVDDEDYTREGLAESIPWKEFGIDEIMQARDGRSGLNLAKWFCPDIVLSDIKMPKLNGIDFARELSTVNPDIKIIFMSGYMEIDYLKSAIQLAAVDYIEKPIDLPMLKGAVKKSVNEIKEKQLIQKISVDRKELQQQKLANALICKENDREMLIGLCLETDFPVKQNYVCLILWNKAKREEKSCFTQKRHSAGKCVNSEVLQNEIQDFLANSKVKPLCNYLGEGKYLAILAFEKKYGSRLPALYTKIADKFPSLILGIGFEAVDIMNIYNSYQTALLAINCAFYDEKERIFMIDEEILHQQRVEPGIYGEFIKILTEEPFRLKSWCEAFFADLRKRKYYRKENIQTLLASFVTAMINQHGELADSLDGIYSQEDIEQRMNRFLTLTEIQNSIMALVEKLELKLQNQSKYGRIIRGVMDYIALHYNEADLSISEIAEYFHFSSNYLSVLFKQETQVTLKQYLSDYRIGKAKKMLENDYYKITEISELCGYANANYFIKVFKEVTDLTPLEYRKQRTE